MQQRNGLSCSCVGDFFTSQEKFFLIRRSQPDDSEGHFVRKANQSSESKNDSEGKQLKKSLKKRNLSNHSVSTPPFPSSPAIDSDKRESELRISFDHQDEGRFGQFSFSRGTPIVSNSTRINFNYPLTTKNSQFVEKQKSYNQFMQQKKSSGLHYMPIQQDKQAVFTPKAQFSTSFYPKLFKQTPNTPQYEMPYQQKYSQKHSYYNYDNFKYSEQGKNIQKINYSKIKKNQNEPIIAKEESLIIQEFDRFFKEKKEEDNLQVNEGKSYSKRQLNKSRRQQRPLLIGRFAESDNESCQESAPSEVIGKGFQNHFNDFWDNQEGNYIKDTFVSQSTNTKISQSQRRVGEIQQIPRGRFGNINTFKSYKHL